MATVPDSTDNRETFTPTPGSEDAGRKEGADLALALVEAGREAGLCQVGFAPATPFVEAGARLRAWVTEGHHGSMLHLEDLGSRDDPGVFLPAARSLVVVAVALPVPDRAAPGGGPEGSHGQIASYARGLDYHTILRGRMRRLSQRLADFSQREVTVRPLVDSAPLLEREAARRAGIGFIGKSTMLIVPGIGPRVLLGVLVVDIEVPPLAPPLESRCGRCRRCLDACPTQAFVRPYVLHAPRCISYLTIEHRGHIPESLRPFFGNCIFGCDACVSACPFDRSEACVVLPSDARPRPPLVRPSLAEWLTMSSSDYRRIARHTALRRADRGQLIRNAIVAAGNHPTPETLEPLISLAQSHPSPIIRSHAVWALGMFSEPRAHAALKALATTETAPEVVAELQKAITQGRASG